VVERWPEAVGEAIARNAWPSRLGRDGTLHIATSDSIWAFELRHRGAEIAGRLGVKGVRFAPGPLSSNEPVKPEPEPRRPSAEHVRLARDLAAGIADEKLRESIQKAVTFSLTRDAENRPV
jgi:Dna[CI] antecedent, DciA